MYGADITIKREVFCDSVARLLPFMECGDLEPELAGIRPILQGPQDDFRDFIIRYERDKGLWGGFINLIGIESPRLASSPSIAKYMRDIVNDALRNQ